MCTLRQSLRSASGLRGGGAWHGEPGAFVTLGSQPGGQERRACSPSIPTVHHVSLLHVQRVPALRRMERELSMEWAAHTALPKSTG